MAMGFPRPRGRPASSSIDRNRPRIYNLGFTDSPIAQPVERRTVNPQVPGSSPGRGAKIS